MKTSYMKLRGSQYFRQRLLLSTLSSTSILVEDIRSESASPGLRPYEVSLLRLLEKISDDCTVEINDTGTKLRYKPGVLIGGKNVVHDCGLSRSVGYFLEPLIVLGLFGKRSLSIRLKGITNDSKDPSVDTFRTTTLHILKHFGVSLDGLELKIESRGAAPLGGGEVVLVVPIVPSSLCATTWIDEGMVKRIRGVTFSTRVSPQFGNRMVFAARGVFNQFLPDVHIFTDHRSGQSSGRSPGYGISLVAETTTGCLISADMAVSHPKTEVDALMNFEEKPELMSPEDVGIQVASMLLGEIEGGGVVDSSHQGLLFLLCALCPPDVSKVRVGKLTPYSIATLRNIRDFLGVKFVIKPEPTTNTVILKCVGCGLKNLSRKIS
ncbi:probable RNA 3'-terminal phosphate cyclase-like protein [Dendrobium catenatum]|uniref:Putative RNA 3'-terminal phosphate cyclase-like protein n=1 Tax=Dendrobium catenatum TaxID=906689 RepID=A0A2I0WQW6_9ASPA|nr:probable RNA 3'-terminal phosphate cyclase-like protein [Dendrobium catenatum]PKU78055.1 putative RNA 3'-terminal phosphate cyclase-like protein [Dendrobium catenatum]